MMQPKSVHDAYEEYQAFNPILKWIHGIRYKYLTALFDDIQREHPGRQIKVVDIGCAQAKAYELLHARYPISYVGIEPDTIYAATAAARYGERPNFKLIVDTIENHYAELQDADLVMSLETLEHIPEGIVVRVIEQIAASNPRYFVCSVPNEVGPIVWVKNIGSLLMGYVRHKDYTWRETFYAGTYQLDRVETHGTGHKGFDWRWLAQTIRHNRKITRTWSSPFRWLPRTLAVSVVFVSHRVD